MGLNANMNSQFRTYITDKSLEAFVAGFEEVLGFSTPAKVIRLSVRTINRRTTLSVLIGLVGKPAGKLFEMPFIEPSHPAGWAALGAEIGRGVESWMRPELQEPLQRDAALRGVNVWTTHELEELAQDLIDSWEALWRSHLNGKVHPRPKEALVTELGAAFLRLVEEKDQQAAAALELAAQAARAKEAPKVPRAPKKPKEAPSGNS